MDLQGSLPQLSFEINNPDNPNTIYITDDPLVNKLTLTVMINAGVGTFTPGQLVPKKDAPQATGSILYLDLSALQLTTTEFEKLNCTAKDWQFMLYPADGLICMTPTEDISLGSGTGDMLDIEINGLLITNPPSIPNVSLNVASFRVSPVASGKLPQVTFFKVLLQNAPDKKDDLHDAIACELSSSADIFNTIPEYDPVANSIDFLFKPGLKPATVKAGPKTAFTVSFVYADAAPGYGALTTPAQALKITMQQGQNAADWKVSKDPSQENPCWILVPPPNVPIVGTGSKSIVQFSIDRIITTFEPGPTLMFVQYRDVPGYNDGSYYILLNKIPHVVIKDLSVTPNPAIVKNGKASVKITWEAKHYKFLTLMPFQEDVTNKNEFETDLNQSIDITLTAIGMGGAANTVIKTITANVLPEINSFVATPDAIYRKDFPHEVKFYWDVDTNDTVYLQNDNDGVKEPVDKSGKLNKQVKKAGMWSIIPKNNAQLYALRRNVLIRAFGQEVTNISPSFIPLSMVASPEAQFVAAVNQANKTIEILNSLTYDPYTNAIPIGAKPLDVLFSADGNYLFVIDDGGTLTVIGVDYNNTTSTYEFKIVTTVVLDYTPARIAVAQQEDYIFITANDEQDDQGHVIVVEKLDKDVFAVKQDIPVGLNASGIALDPTGALLYVTNTGSDTVSVIGYSALNDSFIFVKNIKDFDTAPVDIAVADPLGDTLLVVCKGSNKLIVLRHNDAGSSERQELPLGSSPERIITTRSRAYAFVTNNLGNSVSLIGCGGGVAASKVLEAGIPTVKNPLGISLSPDDTMVFIGSGTQKGGSVINLVNYKLQQDPIKVGQFPTDVVIGNDNKYVVSWHNALITGKGDYSKGIFIYTVATGTVVTKLDTQEIVKCIFSPDIPVKKLFVIVNNDNNISVLDTNSFGLQLKIPIPDGAAAAKRVAVNIAMCGDGKRLFAVVKDTAGQYSLLIYDCDIPSNVYTVIFDSLLFVSNVKSNSILLESTADGSHAFILNVYDQQVWTASQTAGGYGLAPKPLMITSLAKSMVSSPDNNTLYILSQDNTGNSFTILNIADMTTRIYTFPASYRTIVNLQRLSISPDGSRLFITDADITGIRVVSTATLRIIQTLSWPQEINYPIGITLLPDASSIYFACLNSNNIAQISQINS